jgi:hypothetical protein
VDHVDTNDPVGRRDRPNWIRRVPCYGRAHIRDACRLHPRGDTQQGVRIRIGRLENEAGKTSRKMNDVLARATCDLKDDTRRRQDIAKDIENEIAIAQCRRRILAVVAHPSSRIPGQFRP